MAVQAAVLAAAWTATGAAAVAGRRYRQAAIFGQHAADLLGWAEPAPGRIRADRWTRPAPGLDGHTGAQVPGRIRAVVGPTFRATPATWGELNRRATEIGWAGAYTWRFDPTSRTADGAR